MTRLTCFADLPNGDVVKFDEAKCWNKNQSSRHNDTWGFHNGEWIKVTRVIQRKSNPSRHECDARCMNATGLVMKCECACGGKNHGRGSFVCTAEAA